MNTKTTQEKYLLYQYVKQRINETFPFVDDCKGTDKKFHKNGFENVLPELSNNFYYYLMISNFC